MEHLECFCLNEINLLYFHSKKRNGEKELCDFKKKWKEVSTFSKGHPTSSYHHFEENPKNTQIRQLDLRRKNRV